MANNPTRHYNYNRPGVAMLTLKARPNLWFCRISESIFVPLGDRPFTTF
jgi:hypothetical protein